MECTAWPESSPFDGIIRVRFKGSSVISRTSQPAGSPAFQFRINGFLAGSTPNAMGNVIVVSQKSGAMPDALLLKLRISMNVTLLSNFCTAWRSPLRDGLSANRLFRDTVAGIVVFA